jgi:cytoskeletal protein CcmA (bactofilin family)
VVRGELRFVDALRVDGEVLGDVLAMAGGHSLLVISENARV